MDEHETSGQSPEQDGSSAPTWWGDFRIPFGEARRWQLGPMSLYVQRLSGEWRMATVHDQGVADERIAVAEPVAEDIDLLSYASVLRFGMAGDDERVTLAPMLADRAVVSTPQKPFYIPTGAETTVFVGSPLWLRISAGQPPVKLSELPVSRPSDTWFGPSPYRGELCYASRTACRLRLDEFVLIPHRAVTAVRVRNRSTKPFLLERLKLPVSYLPLFCAADGIFWTRDLSFDYNDGEDTAPLRYGGDKPKWAEGARQIAESREQAGKNLAVRVFSSLFTG
ncbi:MAG: hypothetical protein AAGC55_00295 [Myxococcota bacterium]